ncbi:MAG: protein translocase subunit SecD [Pseudomonadota bacterium]|jgi:preprotein translocase subunit SecD|nr:protein translocase subunit SecD [Alphaproteobacteria bacterium]
MILFGFSQTRKITIIGACLAGIIFCLPNMVSNETFEKFPSWLQHTVSLGLDLRGGSHLQLVVDLKTVNAEFLSNLLADVRSSLRKENIGYLNLRIEGRENNPTLFLELRDITHQHKISAIIKKIDSALLTNVTEDGHVTISVDPIVSQNRSKQIIEQSIEVIRRRIDETGTKEPSILRQGSDRIIVQLPGVDDPQEVKKRLGQTAKMSFHMVDSGAQNTGHAGPDSTMMDYIRNGDEGAHKIAVKNQISVSGEHLIDAQATTDSQTGEIGVALRFNNVGARKFAEISANNIGRQFAIVLDGKVLTAPVFRSAIPNGNAEISGGFRSIKEANELALLLRAGSLPAPLKVVEERTVGPSLGADSIHDGRNATIIAFLLVSIFMFLGYSTFGFFANVALIFNMVLLFAGLSLLQATLTLPGIAGIAMTIGMAVDANVLIYERIKEEIRAGTAALQAIEAGFERAMTTIIDSNLTTLIAAAVLYEFGSGPIRGFAVTTAIGISVSMFTALSVTKLITAWWFKNKQINSLPI